MEYYPKHSDCSTAVVVVAAAVADFEIDNQRDTTDVVLAVLRPQPQQQQRLPLAVVGVVVGDTTVADGAAPVDAGAIRAFSLQKRVFVELALPVAVVAAANAVAAAEVAAAGIVVVTDVVRGISEIDVREFKIFTEILQGHEEPHNVKFDSKISS